LTSPIDGFAFGLRRVHKRAQDLIRQLDYMGLLADSELLAGDDQRAIAFLATHDSPFANSFPATSDPTLMFTQREFHIALGRRWVPSCLSLDRSSGHAFEAMGTHALRTSILMGMALHLHLGFPVITFDASTIG
jgi:hypothetical protein